MGNDRGVMCKYKCVDRENNHRYTTHESRICSVCRANMAGWSLRLTQARSYLTQLDIRHRRVENVVGPAAPDPAARAYLIQLKAKRRRRAYAVAHA